MPLSSASVDQLAMLGLVGSLGLATLLWLRSRPVAALVLWMLVIGFVPIWFGVTFVLYLTPAVAVGVLVLASILPTRPSHLTSTDVALIGLFAVCVAPALIGLSTLTSVFTVLTQWMVAFFVGRLLTERVGVGRTYTVVAATFATIGVLALVEFVLKWNPYVDLARPNGLYARWGTLQERGGVLRAEWAFGHSIALGVCLAMAIPMALAAPVRTRWRMGMVLAMMVGAVVSFSRIAMVCSVIGIVLSVLFLDRSLTRRVRGLISVGLVVVTVLAIPLVASTFTAAGTEASGSASYRGSLTSLISSISILGFSGDARRTASGELYFGNYRSIDSALILTGLTYGWIALAVAMLILVAAGVAIVRRAGTPATVAVVAQVPALATVALITQYQMFFWFVIGIAVAHQSLEARQRDGSGSSSVVTTDPVGFVKTPSQNRDLG